LIPARCHLALRQDLQGLKNLKQVKVFIYGFRTVKSKKSACRSWPVHSIHAWHATGL